METKKVLPYCPPFFCSHPLTVASTNLDNALECEIAEGSPFMKALLSLREALMDELADPLELNAGVIIYS
jgi:hypothetical protein